jgi:hypothetical protein
MTSKILVSDWIKRENVCRYFRTSTIEQEEEEEEEDEEIKSVEEEAPIDDGQIKPFSCSLCSVFFSKFEGYREHFISPEHRYKRRDEKKRLGVCFIIFSSIKNFIFYLILRKDASLKVHQSKYSLIYYFIIK